MELPSDPKNLIHGIYNKQGQDLQGGKIKAPNDYPAYAFSDSPSAVEDAYDYNNVGFKF